MKTENHIAIGYSKRQHNYYLWNEEVLICSECCGEVGIIFVLNTFKHKLLGDFVQKTYCLNCYDKIKTTREGSNILVLVEYPLPGDVRPVLPDVLIPVIGDNAHSFSGVILSNEEYDKDVNAGVKIINNCRVAFNPNQSRQDLPNYYEKYQGIAEKGDEVEVLEVEDGLKLLDKLISAVPERETKEIEKVEK